jgi:predicted nucleic acid-binding protein
MKRVYIDTSVLLAKWVPTDPYHEECIKIVEVVKNEKIAGIFSGLALVEVSSVVERISSKTHLPEYRLLRSLQYGFSFHKALLHGTKLYLCN